VLAPPDPVPPPAPPFDGLLPFVLLDPAPLLAPQLENKVQSSSAKTQIPARLMNNLIFRPWLVSYVV
jgi:hypothetical protein